MSMAIPQRQIVLPRFEFPAWMHNRKSQRPERVKRMGQLNPLGGAASLEGLSAGVVQVAFTPADLTTKVLWLDLQDATKRWQDAAFSTPATLVNDNLGGIQDKSGAGNHATQNTAGRFPTLQQNGSIWLARHDGSNDALNLTGVSYSTSMTLLMVTTPTSQTQDYLLGSDAIGNSPTILSKFDPGGGVASFEWFNAISGADRQTLSVSGSGLSIVLVTQSNSSYLKGYYNSLTPAFNVSPTTNLHDSLKRIGGADGTNNMAAIDWAEFVLCVPAASSSEITNLINYAAARYSITLV